MDSTAANDTAEPDDATILAAIGATWPPASYRQRGDWLTRDGGGGGSRVSASTAMTRGAVPDPAEAGPLVMVRPGEAALDAALEGAGYALRDPTRILIAPSATIAQGLPRGPRTTTGDGPVARMEEIWAEDGIGPERLAIMERATAPKAWLAGRIGDRPAGAGFVAAHGSVAMLHALTVTGAHRRNGLATDLTRAAAHWAAINGAPWLALLVTEANAPARALYARLGFEDRGGYHYRIREDR
ncbi:GNAT family N-acetyltransferase [Roseobacter sp. HKCCA0434]|uniref:GNAT family N-acetyltransferase n=1 Tax=Roseobacter sp. HKCCA0434 TaxID=3079297 RepID=UPI002905F7B4|nr:GNAT family N-acetyltransferase [Roseobacter sp. HKCCA0434]